MDEFPTSSRARGNELRQHIVDEITVELLPRTWNVSLESSSSADDFGGCAPLHKAAYTGQVDVVESLLLAGADPDILDSAGCVPLHLAADAGHFGVVLALLDRGADPAVKSQLGQTALHRACWRGHSTLAACFIKRCGADALRSLDPLRNSPIDYSVLAGHSALATQLLHSIQDLEVGNLLHSAAASGMLEVAEVLLERGANVNASRPAATYQEASTLLQHAGGQTCSNLRQTPLNEACAAGHTSVVKWFVRHGADPTISEVSTDLVALHLAAIGGHTELVEYLCDDSRINLESKDSLGWTALHYAVLHDVNASSFLKKSKPTLVLLRAGADPNARMDDGRVALHDAVESGDLETTELLLQFNADPSVTEPFSQRTCLGLAVANGHSSIAELLEERGCTDNEPACRPAPVFDLEALSAPSTEAKSIVEEPSTKAESRESDFPSYSGFYSTPTGSNDHTQGDTNTASTGSMSHTG